MGQVLFQANAIAVKRKCIILQRTLFAKFRSGKCQYRILLIERLCISQNESYSAVSRSLDTSFNRLENSEDFFLRFLSLMHLK
jgi:hypothetical protein